MCMCWIGSYGVMKSSMKVCCVVWYGSGASDSVVLLMNWRLVVAYISLKAPVPLAALPRRLAELALSSSNS